MIHLGEKEVILFNGDSITDAGRDRSSRASLAGYTTLVAEGLAEKFPNTQFSFHNRGIGGNTSRDLLGRVRGELNDLRPTVFTMLIGINDVWRKYDSNFPTSHEQYFDNVTKILDTVKEYTDKIIVLEPFLLPTDPKKAEFYEDLMPKILLLRKAAAAVKATYIPLDGIFAAHFVNKGGKSEYYSYDGVHLTDAGNEVVARQIVAAIQ